MIGKLKEVLRLAGDEWQITLVTRDNPVNLFYRLKDKLCAIDIKRAGNKRTKTANDFLWAMCTDIGNALRPPLPKEQVYRQAIREVGESSLMLMESDRVEAFREIWGSRGIGWFSEVVDDSRKNPGCKVLMVYYGTSVYDSEAMSRVIDYVKQDMQAMGLPIPLSEKEERRLLETWGKA